MLGDTGTRRRWIGVPEAGQVWGKNGASGPGKCEKALESAPRVGARVEAEEGSAFLEAAPRRDGVVDVQLAVAALEIAASDAWPARSRGP
jgi:hypothetical protein